MKLLITILALLFVQNSLQQDEGCTLFRLDPFENMNQPLFLNNITADFLYPPINATHSWINITVGDTILISCIGGLLGVKTEDSYQYINSTEYAVCGNDSNFHIGDLAFNQTEIICQKTINTYGSVREIPDEPCGIDGTLIEIGFDIPLIDKFITQSTICFDKQVYTAQYAHYNVTPYARFAETVLLAAPMSSDDLYPSNVDVSNLYNVEELQKNINPTLGLPEDSKKYFRDQYTFTTQILSDVKSFMYGQQQFAAFRLPNAVPMWVSLFNFLWVYQDVLDYSVQYSLNLDVYSGTHGVLTLPHEETGEPVEIYLYQSKETGKVIKVPEILWELVYEPHTKRALVVVIHDNMYLDVDSVENYCTDIYDDIQWINWAHPNETVYGYGYICSYDDLKSSVPELPDLEVTGILY